MDQRGWVRVTAYTAILLVLVLVSAEITARIQDWMTRSTAFWSVPDWERDLFVKVPFGVRGRPHGQYLKWTLNEYGFRAGEMTRRPAKSQPRVILLGSSETFGLYESPGREFPAVVAERLKPRYEVVNAALPGMTIRSTIPYWTGWAKHFLPAVVLIYPSPLFYLNDGFASEATDRTSKGPAAFPLLAEQSRGWQNSLSLGALRLMQRARERLDVPDFIQRWRDLRTIQAATADKPAGWLFEAPPQDRAAVLIRDLDTLVAAIRRDGARPIVITHVSRVTDPPRDRDMDWLERARVNTPRATARVIAQFESLVNDELLDWARLAGVDVIDVRPTIAGREELFGDLIHFNDAGAAAMAAAIAAHFERVAELPREAGRVRDAVQ